MTGRTTEQGTIGRIEQRSELNRYRKDEKENTSWQQENYYDFQIKHEQLSSKYFKIFCKKKNQLQSPRDVLLEFIKYFRPLFGIFIKQHLDLICSSSPFKLHKTLYNKLYFFYLSTKSLVRLVVVGIFLAAQHNFPNE